VWVADDLAALLASGERAAFHGRPAAGLEPLRRAVELAHGQGLVAEAGAAGWLLGVCLSSVGRYGGALQVLEPTAAMGADAAVELQVVAGLAAAAVAAVNRQLGRHGSARAHDEQALTLTGGAGEAGFDAVVGLAADAVGLGEAGAAREHQAAAKALVEEHAHWWRQRVRLGWLEAEIGLLTGEPEAAAEVAHEAVELAERSGAPRHVAKGLLFLGVAQVESAREDDAAATLRRAALLAESLGTLPLLWPARAVLGALVAERDPGESERCLASARRAVQTIGDDLPDELRDAWLERGDVAALRAGAPG
jgi:tetratricopeptide (TPR) repeat protein